MKVLIIRNYPSYIDIQHNTYNVQEIGLAKALTRMGHQCDVLLWTGNEEKTIRLKYDEKIIRVFYKKGKVIFKNTIYCKCNTLFEKYDILQPCEYNQFESWYLASKFPTKTIIYHGPYYSKFNKKYNMMCKFFDALFLDRYQELNTPFIVKSNFAHEFLFQKGIRNITVAGVGIDQNSLTNQESDDKSDFQRKMENDEDVIKILYIGRLERRRNVLFLLDVFRLLSEKIGKIKFYIIGSGKREYIKKVWKRVDELNLHEDIRYEESIEQKYLSAIYKQADFLILPTEYEIFGMVLLEAMNYGIVCASTTNGGSSTLIKNDVNGLVIDEMDPKYWANTICNLTYDTEKMKRIKENARETIQRNFTWDKIASVFVQKYEELHELK